MEKIKLNCIRKIDPNGYQVWVNWTKYFVTIEKHRKYENGKCKVSYPYWCFDKTYDQHFKAGFIKKHGIIPNAVMSEFLSNISKKVKIRLSGFTLDPINVKSFYFEWSSGKVKEIVEPPVGHHNSLVLLKKLMKSNQLIKSQKYKGKVSWDETKSPITYKVDYEYYKKGDRGWDWYRDELEIKLK